ncbi:hypothetical protein CAPTEDRAFT_144302 [Capitella teleta]|uniref:Peroxisomal bifunctional enzyme n=1 Tax=Capitella teleta TaxID=283909 RepID=R7URL1_CAPTE|nr:hypothetical protein CAPTEDRAFT_144302 [Capitella teleta]|eukprot:ELU09144.1 hypothetical protein CAPTEDRAFT_144302 [Capitella teleta]
MVDYIARDGVALLQVNNPPVNALSHHVRVAIEEGLKKAGQDPRIKSIVISGKGSFIAGADIKDVSKPTILELCDLIESSGKPVVAAIKGFALGGGHEIAISCHYRIAHEKSKFGFPEVDIGILPAAGGTQRFPRLVGLEAALDLIPSGRHIGAAQAFKLGIVDKVVRGDAVEEAVKFAKSIAGEPLVDRRTSQRPVMGAENAFLAAAVKLAMKKKKGMIAPIVCLSVSFMGSLLPFEQGIQVEAAEAVVVFTSGQMGALQYAFFAQRAAPKWLLPCGASFKTVKGRPIRNAAVIGAGTMGTGITMAMLNAGIPVTLVEQDRKFLDKGVSLLKLLYAGSVSLRKITQDQCDAILSKLNTAVGYKSLTNVDLVIEAVYENMALKKQIFAELDRICPPETFLWTNTSALDIDEIASATRRPDKVLGTHFFVPAYHMKLLENVRGKLTSAETVASAQMFGTRIGKIPVVVGNCHGFVGNRMLHKYVYEADFLIEEGCWPEDVDMVAENFGLPLGPFKVRDLSGLDIRVRGLLEQAKAAGIEINPATRFLNGERISLLSKSLVDKGHCGRKTGRGFYNYGKPGGKIPLNDRFIKDVIVEYCAERGIERRKVAYQEIEERLFLPLINEGFKILEEGIASKPEDIDTIWLLGYAWPRHTGGPMYYANMVGLDKIYNRICHYNELHKHSAHWQPSLLLKKLAASKTPMKDWMEVAQASSKL